MLAAMLPVVLSLTIAQTENSAFLGRWVAEYQGTTHIRLELRRNDGSLEGGIALGPMRVDDKGVVVEAGEAPAMMRPIRDIIVRGSTVSFVHLDDHDVDRFELRIDANGAALHFMLSEEDRKNLLAEGVPTPKPVRLRKVAP